jgi:hypothetical protein
MHNPDNAIAQVTYTKLVDETCSRMISSGSVRTRIQDTYAHRVSTNGKLTLRAKEWQIGSPSCILGNLRMVHIQGGKSEIINTWIFPTCPESRPVFAAELIAVCAETRVAFVDIQVPVGNPTLFEDVAAVSSALAPRFSCLPCNEKPPQWAVHASAGHFTYGRNVPFKSLGIIEDCYLSYLDAYLNAFMYSGVEGCQVSPGDHDHALSRLQEYQHHHMQHSPGNLYLSKLFGSDWTEAFMIEFLFAKPRG